MVTKRVFFGLAAVLAAISPLGAQNEGYWTFSARKEWLYSANPNFTDRKYAQNITATGIQFTYNYFDQNGTGKWLTDTENFQWELVDPVTGNSVLPIDKNSRLLAGQKVRARGTLTFNGQYYSNADAKIVVGEDPLQTPYGWRNADTLYPLWGYKTDAVVYLQAASGRTSSAFNDFTVPRTGSSTTPLTIRCVTGMQGSAAVEYVYEWVPPAVPAITAVVQNAGGQRSITPGAWFTVWGSALSPAAREWKAADFSGNRLPTALDGVQVLVNSKAAVLSYISPGQINALAPTDTFTGDVDVVVVNANGKSAAYRIALAKFAPALFVYQGTSAKYAVANSGTAFIGKAGLIPGLTTRPAQPGETITLYGTGFGPANPPFTPEMMVSGYAPLANAVNVRIGGAAATVQWSGQIGSGLYQFNVQVPNIANGDQEIIAEIGGVATPSGVAITVQR